MVSADRIDLVFQPLAIARNGSEVKGQMLRLEQIIAHEGSDRDVKDQYFRVADGIGTQWRARCYTDTRRSSYSLNCAWHNPGSINWDMPRVADVGVRSSLATYFLNEAPQ